MDFTMQRDDLDRHQALFFDQLEPQELSDILFELDVLTVSDHDNIEENSNRKGRIEIFDLWGIKIHQKYHSKHFVMGLLRCCAC